MNANRLRCALAVFVLAGAIVGAGRGSVARAATEAEVKASVARAVQNLRSKLAGHVGGQLGLSALALLKAGVPPTDADVKRALDLLASRVEAGTYKPFNHHRYEAGVTLMALSTADPVLYKPQIEAITKYILEAQQTPGGWFYPAGHGLDNPSVVGDTSITQYALLGLWEATRAGVNVPKQAFDRAAAWHLMTQLREGSFTYQPSRTSQGLGTHSMAAAGTASMLLTRMMLYPEAKELPTEEVEEEAKGGTKGAKKKKGGIKYGILFPAPIEPTAAEIEAEKAVKNDIPPDDPNYKATTKLVALSNGCARGLKWLSTNYRVNLSDNQFQTGQQWNAYYLYTIERLAALSGLAEINGHDWYVEGCDYLISKQTAEGFWDMDQAGADADTCFAIMFMVKATEKTLKKSPRRKGRDPRMGGGVLVGARGLPDDLTKLEVGGSGVKVRKLKGAVDELLGELEKLDSSQVEAAQEAIVETILTEDPEALVGQQKRLERLSRDRRAEVRRTAVWGLGRTNELNAIPFILERLEDVDLTVIIEARNALRFMTRKPDFLELSESPTPEELAEIIKLAKKWYLTVRPYSERDDLLEVTEAKP